MCQVEPREVLEKGGGLRRLIRLGRSPLGFLGDEPVSVNDRGAVFALSNAAAKTDRLFEGQPTLRRIAIGDDSASGCVPALHPCAGMTQESHKVAVASLGTHVLGRATDRGFIVNWHLASIGWCRSTSCSLPIRRSRRLGDQARAALASNAYCTSPSHRRHRIPSSSCSRSCRGCPMAGKLLMAQ